MILENIEQEINAAIQAEFGVESVDITIDFPERFGDLALNCFYLARTLKKAPPMIAETLAAVLSGRGPIVSAEAASGYVNMTIDRRSLFESVISSVIDDPSGWGRRPSGSGRIMVEFASPNTNKPLHLGHIRNVFLGDSVSRLLEAAGHEVIRANLVNDRGIHICKSMLAYHREGHGKTPDSEGIKGDHFVGDYYVRFEKRFRDELAAYRASHPDDAGITPEDFFPRSEWGSAAQDMLRRWEAGDAEVIELWKTMNGWVMDGFQQTYDSLGIRFDRIYLESETYKLGKEIVEEGLARGVFQRRADGAVVIDLTAEKLDEKVVLRSDGTSVYITQDIGTTVMKAETHGLDGQIFVVGDEQIYHFKVLFTILRKLGYEWADNLHHLAYGMVHLPEGKMKSREGKVVDADDLVAEVTALAAAEIKKRDAAIDPDELAVRARRIGLSALKFMILNVTPKTTMTYDPAASVSFEGDTGPYVLYAYARIRRMIEDSNLDETSSDCDVSMLGDKTEVRLALKILEYPRIVAKAAATRNPAAVTSYLLGLARAYHSHNRAVPILKAEDAALRKSRLLLSLATADTLRSGLDHLGIETVDRM